MAKNKLDTFKNHLGYNGKKVNIEKALEELEEIGANATNDIGETPLIIAAYLGQTAILKTVINKVDNVDFSVPEKTTASALLEACGQRRLESIQLLVEAGANLEQEDKYGLTPLAKIFTNTFSDPIPCATYLLSQGAKMTERVIKLGAAWNSVKFNEWLKGGAVLVPEVTTNKASLPSLDIAYLHKTVNKESYFETAKVIWKTLVPKSGQADTVQGELLRAIEKLRDEAQRNGNGNFNKNCHGLLLAFLRRYLTDEHCFDEAVRKEISEDLDKLSVANRPYTEDDVYDRVTNRIIDWCLKQPELMEHIKDERLYC
ncbi:ankyrin repeat domain-containing protein [Chitinophaga qingshengii]|uniref:Ankyrin repeat domain-containing protein n=1 Tax=Chitinophaga qingshengii TaxID=1569794 RepID=A0ABR7TQ85_9BACT|nr:ankyrin repeat domain-containing protein [Chitinophaga qingshengii]MBC9932644.1 ankyrin repeat domain-containing protein [Chitinophaga qingshengii]